MSLVTLALVLGMTLLSYPLAADPRAEAIAPYTIMEWRVAADSGDPIAATNLGKIYEVGLGVPRDAAKAYYWYAIAASLDASDARALRDSIVTRLTRPQLDAVSMWLVLRSPPVDSIENAVETVRGKAEADDAPSAPVDDHPIDVQLSLAVLSGDIEPLTDLFAAGADSNSVLPSGDTLLMQAVGTGNVETVNAVLDAGAAIDTRGSGNWTPLLLAVFLGYEDLSLLLLERGADPDIVAEDGTTVAMLAEALDMPRLHARLPDSDPGEYSKTLLFTAVEAGDVETVRGVLASGVPVDARDQDGWTALAFAAASGQLELAALLIEAGADVDAATTDGMTPLFASAISGDTELIRKLVDAGADANHISREGWTPLVMAIVNDRRNVARLLIESGADPKLRGPENVEPVALAFALGQEDIVALLGGMPELQRPATSDALHRAVLGGDEIEVARLIEAGVDPDTPNSEGWTPLLLAVVEDKITVVEALLDAGASPLAMNYDGESSLMAATRLGNQVAVDRLLAVSGSVDSIVAQRNRDGRTPLMLAVISEDPLLVRKLARVSDVNVIDNAGISPAMAATLIGNPRMVEILVDAGANTEAPADGVSLQDVARQTEAWNVLAVLPNDRMLPSGFEAGASWEVRREVQRRLRDWGYYDGAIDGVLGAGSVAALRAYLENRKFEIKAMSDYSVRQFTVRRDAHAEEGYAILSIKESRSTFTSDCKWNYVEWNQSNPDYASSFLGCVMEGVLSSSGFALVEFKDFGSEVYLFGEDGWDSIERIGR